METDKDHIHILVTFPPSYSIEQTVRRIKQVSTNYIYERYEEYLKQYYWKKKRVLWTHEYFCSTIGEVSESTLKKYIENQAFRMWFICEAEDLTSFSYVSCKYSRSLKTP